MEWTTVVKYVWHGLASHLSHAVIPASVYVLRRLDSCMGTQIRPHTHPSPQKFFQSLLVPMTIDAEWILYHWEYLNIEAGELSLIVMRMRFERSFWLILFCNRRNRFRVKCVFTSSFRLRSRGSPAVIVAAVRAGRVFYKLLILTFLNISKWNISSCISKYT